MRGDPGRLRQILTNLLGNALKFTAEGEIALHVELDSSDKRGSRIRFSISDTGIGIAPDRVERLFDSFSQADVSTTRQFGGTGLGLAIAMQMTQLMGSTIVVQSTLGAGTTFSLTPYFLRQPEEAQSISNPRGNLEGTRALLISASRWGRTIFSHYCKTWGIELQTEVNEKKGLRILREAAAAGRAFDFAILNGNANEAWTRETAESIRSGTMSPSPETGSKHWRPSRSTTSTWS